MVMLSIVNVTVRGTSTESLSTFYALAGLKKVLEGDDHDSSSKIM
jgi:hypothetical protein